MARKFLPVCAAILIVSGFSARGATVSSVSFQIGGIIPVSCNAAIVGGSSAANSAQLVIDQACNTHHVLSLSYDPGVLAGANVVLTFGGSSVTTDGSGTTTLGTADYVKDTQLLQISAPTMSAPQLQNFMDTLHVSIEPI